MAENKNEILLSLVSDLSRRRKRIMKREMGLAPRPERAPGASHEHKLFPPDILSQRGRGGAEGHRNGPPMARLRILSALLEMGVIPVVNENDSVSSAEIETGRHKVLGDNDTLSAIVARLCGADLLVLLSDIDGLYDADPHTHPDATLIHQVRSLTPEILEMAGGAGSWRGTGGMATKLSAARIAMDAGCDMVITNGSRTEDLYGIAEGRDIGTRFLAAR